MEEKIYQRQVTKQSLSQRVIDEHQLDRHFTSAELAQLYSFEPDADTEIVHNIPDDDLLKSLLVECKRWILKYHEHDSLLENKVDEGLSEEERRLAWAEYQAEQKRAEMTHAQVMSMLQQQQQQLLNGDNDGDDLDDMRNQVNVPLTK